MKEIKKLVSVRSLVIKELKEKRERGKKNKNKKENEPKFLKF